ncbi:MAG: hypothetical protein AAGK78_01435, partial [Planctomycetota bacterium]
ESGALQLQHRGEAVTAGDVAKLGSVVLALDGELCYAATIAPGDLPKPGSDAFATAAAYRMEASLPISVDDCVADFAQQADGKLLGVAAEVRPVLELIENIEHAGGLVVSVTPLPMLAAQQHGQDGVHALASGESADLVAVRDGRPAGWMRCDRTPAALSLRCKLLGGESAPDHETAIVDAETLADEIVAGQARPWIELRRGPLSPIAPLRRIRKPMLVAMAAASVALLIATGAMWHRGSQWQDRTEAAQSALNEQFIDALGGPVPAAPLATLRAEVRGLRNNVSGDELPRSALTTLQRLLAGFEALPGDLGYRVELMAFDAESADLTLTTSNPSATQAVLGALESTGLRIEPIPAERNDDGTWTLNVRAVEPAGDTEVARG